MIDEKMLVGHLKGGDKQAFAGIYEKYHRQVHMIALKYLKDEDVAQDITQEIFIKLWNYRENLKEELSLQGFLMRSVHNLVLNTIRNRKTERAKYTELGVHNTESTKNLAEEELVLSDYARIAEMGIKELSPARQAIFRLRSSGCLSNHEVASQLGLSINTVKCHFSQASRFLRKYLMDRVD